MLVCLFLDLDCWMFMRKSPCSSRAGDYLTVYGLGYAVAPFSGYVSATKVRYGSKAGLTGNLGVNASII